MKSVLQNLRTGVTEVIEVPAPGAGPGKLLIHTNQTLISAGTERSLVEFSKQSLLSKARSQPDRVKQVLDKIKTDGLLPTMEAIFNKLDEPMPLGYCNAGVVLDVGPDVTAFKAGDRVISNGNHAEMVCVPQNLCAKIPDSVTDDQAVFTVISSIGLQGIRLLNPTLGERFVVYGLGLIGLISVQLLRAHGCEVMGVDIHPGRLELAKQFGAKIVQAGEGSNPSASAMAWTEGKGVDGVLITAAAKTDEIMHQSAEMSRKRGRIVLVGVVGLDLRRSDFYKKELSFQVSCSYGPGRYDDAYEQAGQDYPYAFVRWTEQRNFEAILSSLANGALSVNDMISCRFPLADASEAYAVISNDPSALGVLLQYPPTEKVYKEREITVTVLPAPSSGQAVVGVIGAGNYSRMMLMPCLSKTSARLAYIADLNGAAAHNLAQKFNVGKATTDYRTILEDPAVQAIFIATGHSMHARLICESLAAGKHTFTEKPLATNAEQLEKIRQAYQEAKDRLLMVGFNRRFSPHVQKIKNLLAGRGEPLCMSMTINAGFVPSEHPIHDVVKEGGRIIGEGCHFIDLLAFLANSPVAGVSAAMMGKGVAVHEDKMSITLLFEDGSVGTVNYFANGHKSYPKETLEVFSDQRVLRMENFRRLLGYGFPRFKKFKTSRQDKGHAAEFAAFVERVASGGGPPIPFEELYNSTQASFAAMVAARENKTIVL